MNGRNDGAVKRFRAKRKASQLWYTPEQYDLVKRAARLDRRPMTQFAIAATLRAAAQTTAKKARRK